MQTMLILDDDLHGVSLSLFTSSIYKLIKKPFDAPRTHYMDVEEFNEYVEMFNLQRQAYLMGEKKVIVGDIAIRNVDVLEKLFKDFSKSKVKLVFIDHHTDIEVMNKYPELKRVYGTENIRIEYGNPIEMVVTLAKELGIKGQFMEIIESRNMKKWLSFEPTAWTVLGALMDSDFHTAQKLCSDAGICPNSPMFWTLVWTARWLDFELQRSGDPEWFVNYVLSRFVPFEMPIRKRESVIAKGADLFARRESTPTWKDAELIYNAIEENGTILKTEHGTKIGVYPKPLNFLRVKKGKGQLNKYVNVISTEFPKEKRIQYFITFTIGYNPAADKYQTILKAWGPEWFRGDLSETGVRALIKDVLDQIDVEKNAYGHLGVMGARIDVSDPEKYNYDFEEYVNEMIEKAERLVVAVASVLRNRVEKKKIKPAF